MAKSRKIIRLGNSFAVVLPRYALESIGVCHGEFVDIDAYPGQMITLTATDQEKARSNLTIRREVDGE